MDNTWSTVSRITGNDELLATDVSNDCGKNRLHTESVTRFKKSFIHTVKSVASTPILLQVNPTALPNRKYLIIQNQSDYSIKIGGSDVLWSNGLTLHAFGTLNVALSEDISLYAIAENEAVSVFVGEIS